MHGRASLQQRAPRLTSHHEDLPVLAAVADGRAVPGGDDEGADVPACDEKGVVLQVTAKHKLASHSTAIESSVSGTRSKRGCWRENHNANQKHNNEVDLKHVTDPTLSGKPVSDRTRNCVQRIATRTPFLRRCVTPIHTAYTST